MAIACGTDIIYIPSVERIRSDATRLKRFFHPQELKQPTVEHLAGLLAAKEAFFKALGMMPKFTEIQVIHEKTGKPTLIVSPVYNKFKSCDVSISHDKEYAIAFVVLEL